MKSCRGHQAGGGYGERGSRKVPFPSPNEGRQGLAAVNTSGESAPRVRRGRPGQGVLTERTDLGSTLLSKNQETSLRDGEPGGPPLRPEHRKPSRRSKTHPARSLRKLCEHQNTLHRCIHWAALVAPSALGKSVPFSTNSGVYRVLFVLDLSSDRVRRYRPRSRTGWAFRSRTRASGRGPWCRPRRASSAPPSCRPCVGVRPLPRG